MDKNRHFLIIKLRGKTVRAGRIPVSQLLRLLSELSKVLNRVGRVLLGEIDSVRRGRVLHSIKDETALDFVKISHGSPETVLELERSSGQQAIEGMDFGLEIVEKSIEGLEQIQTMKNDLPPGFDAGVLLAWRDFGMVLEQGISEIEFVLNNRSKPLITRYTMPGYHRVQQRIQGPAMNIRTIEGRLLMADFKEHGTRCRIHPSYGDPIMCLFSEAQRDEVLENILHFVRIVGEAREDALTGKITCIQLHDIQRLENREEECKELLPQGEPLSSDFWQAPSLDDLAHAQGVAPISDITTLFGTWPGDPDDGFEKIVNDLRKRDILAEVRP